MSRAQAHVNSIRANAQLRGILRRDMRRMRRPTREGFVDRSGVGRWWTGQVSASGLPLLSGDCPAELVYLQHTSRAARRRGVTHLEDLLERCGVEDVGAFIAETWRASARQNTRKRARVEEEQAVAVPKRCRREDPSLVSALCRAWWGRGFFW